MNCTVVLTDNCVSQFYHQLYMFSTRQQYTYRYIMYLDRHVYLGRHVTVEIRNTTGVNYICKISDRSTIDLVGLCLITHLCFHIWQKESHTARLLRAETG